MCCIVSLFWWNAIRVPVTILINIYLINHLETLKLTKFRSNFNMTRKKNWCKCSLKDRTSLPSLIGRNTTDSYTTWPPPSLPSTRSLLGLLFIKSWKSRTVRAGVVIKNCALRILTTLFNNTVQGALS